MAAFCRNAVSPYCDNNLFSTGLANAIALTDKRIAKKLISSRIFIIPFFLKLAKIKKIRTPEASLFISEIIEFKSIFYRNGSISISSFSDAA